MGGHGQIKNDRWVWENGLGLFVYAELGAVAMTVFRPFDSLSFHFIQTDAVRRDGSKVHG